MPVDCAACPTAWLCVARYTHLHLTLCIPCMVHLPAAPQTNGMEVALSGNEGANSLQALLSIIEPEFRHRIATVRACKAPF